MMNVLSCGNASHSSRHALAALLAAGTILVSSAAAATTYQVIPLSPPPGSLDEIYLVDINEAGEIAGYAFREDDSHAVAWGAAPDYTPRWLPEGHATASRALGINDDGHIIGDARFGGSSYRAVLWRPNGAIRLGELPGGQNASHAYDINANGTVVGEISTDVAILPVHWSTPRVPSLFIDDLDGLFAYMRVAALNDFGTVVGSWRGHANDHMHPFRWGRERGMQLLGELPGVGFHYALDVNAAGRAAGFSDDPDDDPRALLWNTDGSVLDLGDVPGSYYDSAFQINNAGVVVGEYAFDGGAQGFVWTAATGMQSIIDLIDPLDPVLAQLGPGDTIRIAAINNAGVMAGTISPANPGEPSTPIVLVPQP